MSNILDLSVLQPENWIIKLVDGDEFTIPGSISLGSILELEKKYKNIQENQDNTKDYEFMKDTIKTILQLDKKNANKVTDEYIVENDLDSIRFMSAIIDGFIAHATNIRNDENLGSPQN